MEDYIGAVEALPVPTLAVIEGFAIGGGLAIAAACDLRIATPDSRFGVPIARTLGNCLSIANYARLVAGLGASRAKRMLLLAENLSAEEALAGGFLSEVVAAADLDRRVAELSARLVQHAPLTMRVSKEAIGRILHAGLPDGDDLVRVCYGKRRLSHRREGIRGEAHACMDGTLMYPDTAATPIPRGASRSA